MRPSDAPKRDQMLLSMFGQPIDLDGIEVAPTDERLEVEVRWLDHIVGFRLADPDELMN
jgi:hypothetical protein